MHTVVPDPGYWHLFLLSRVPSPFEYPHDHRHPKDPVHVQVGAWKDTFAIRELSTHIKSHTLSSTPPNLSPLIHCTLNSWPESWVQYFDFWKIWSNAHFVSEELWQCFSSFGCRNTYRICHGCYIVIIDGSSLHFHHCSNAALHMAIPSKWCLFPMVHKEFLQHTVYM